MNVRDWFDGHKLLLYFLTATGSVGAWIIFISYFIARATVAQSIIAIGVIMLCYIVILGFVTVVSCVQDSITEVRTTMIEEHTLTRAAVNVYLRELLVDRIVRETMRGLEEKEHAEVHH
jgi:hypothetical protein